MSTTTGQAARRMAAAAIDTGISAAASAAAIGMVFAARHRHDAGGRPRPGRSPAAGMATDSLLTVAPAVALGTADDAGHLPVRARLGLRVLTRDGARPGVAWLVVRNLVKFSPWQAAHLGVRQQVMGLGGRMGDVAGMTALFGSMGAVLVNVVQVVRGASTLHDLAAGTRVEQVPARA